MGSSVHICVKYLTLDCVQQSYAVLEVLPDHLQPPMRQQVPPGEYLQFAIPYDQLLDVLGLVVAGVELPAGVRVPLAQLLEEELHAGEQLHQRRCLRVEGGQHVVGQEEEVVEDGALVLLENVADSALQAGQGLEEEPRLLGVRIVIEVVGLGKLHVGDVHDCLLLSLLDLVLQAANGVFHPLFVTLSETFKRLGHPNRSWLG